MCSCIIINLQYTDYQYIQFSCAILHISFTKVVSRLFPLFQLVQLIKPYLLLPKPHHALLYHFGDCTHYRLQFVIIAQRAQHSIFIILIFPMLRIMGMYTNTWSDPNSNHYLSIYCFRHSGYQICIFCTSHIDLLLLNHCLCRFNCLSCHRDISCNIILNWFLPFFIAYTVYFLSYLHCKLLFRLQAVQCAKGQTLSASKMLWPSVV